MPLLKARRETSGPGSCILLAALLSAGCSGPATVNPTPLETTNPTVISGIAARNFMQSGTVELFQANNDGSNGLQLGTDVLGPDGTWSFTLDAAYGSAFRVMVVGGTYVSELDGSTQTTSSAITALIDSLSSAPSKVAVTPLSTLVDSYATAQAMNGENLVIAHQAANAAILGAYGFPSGTVAEALIPGFSSSASGDTLRTDAVLGAFEAEASSLGLADRGALVTALAEDVTDGVFNGQSSSGASIPLGSGLLATNAGTSEFLSGLQIYAATASGQLPQLGEVAASIETTLPSSPVAANVTTPAQVQTQPVSWAIPFTLTTGVDATVVVEAQQNAITGALPDQSLTIELGTVFTEVSTNQMLSATAANTSASLINGTLQIFFQGTFPDGVSFGTSGYNVVDGTTLPLILQLNSAGSVEAGNDSSASEPSQSVSWPVVPVSVLSQTSANGTT